MYCYKVEHYNAAEDGLVIIANTVVWTESRSSFGLAPAGCCEWCIYGGKLEGSIHALLENLET